MLLKIDCFYDQKHKYERKRKERAYVFKYQKLTQNCIIVQKTCHGYQKKVIKKTKHVKKTLWNESLKQKANKKTI